MYYCQNLRFFFISTQNFLCRRNYKLPCQFSVNNYFPFLTINGKCLHSSLSRSDTVMFPIPFPSVISFPSKVFLLKKSLGRRCSIITMGKVRWWERERAPVGSTKLMGLLWIRGVRETEIYLKHCLPFHYDS